VEPELINLVPNPGFEQGTANWTISGTQHIDRSVAHTGHASMRLEVKGPEPGRANLGTTVPVKPNTRYRCELWIMRKNVGVTGTYVSERDADNHLVGLVTQIGRPVPKEDGVWHHQVWEIRTGPLTTRLNIRGDIYKSIGTIWLDDFLVAEIPEQEYRPVRGQVTATDGGLKLTGASEDMGLELEATLAEDEECLRVDGVVRDTTGDDRVVGVRFSLPINAQGWTWDNDASESEVIEGDSIHRYTYKSEAGEGECSIYPWSALDGPDAGLTMALPLSQGPRIFIIEHDQRAPRYSLTFYFGLSADAGQNPSSAPFSFVIYRHDPAWGMRSAMERYYRLFADSFIKRPTFEGYLNYARYEQFDPATHSLIVRGAGPLPDASDFGEGYKFLYHVHGCYDFRMVPYDKPERPSDEWVIAALQKMVEEEKTRPRGYVPSAETLKKLVYDSEGHIRYIGDTRYWRPQEGYNHNDWPGWGLNFRVNEDPDVSDHIARACTAKLEDYAATDHLPWDACVTADAIEGYFSEHYGLNYRREHWATTLLPLTFGKDSRAPAMVNNIWDFHHKYWWPTTNRYQVAVYGNSNCYHQIFTSPYVDVPMIEGMWDRDHWGRFERYLRAVSHHKIWRWWRVPGERGGYDERNPEQVRRHFAAGLAYAIYPCVGAMGELVEQHRELFRQYVPAIEELSIAGWEPVPYATTDADVVIERYGSYADGELHLALRNYSDQEVTATAKLDLAGLGVRDGAKLVAADVLPGFARTEPVDPGGWTVTVPAHDARAFWVGGADQVAAHGFRQAALDLGRIERFYHADLTDDNRTLIATAREAAESDGDALDRAAGMSKAADELLASVETKGKVDLTKLVYRLKAHLSAAAVGELGLDLSPARLVADAPRGAACEATWALKWPAAHSVTHLRATLHSPWEEVAAAAKAALSVTDGQAAITGELPVPADPPRGVMPFLLEISGKADGRDFAIFAPADVVVGASLTASAAPTRVFRGDSTRVQVTFTSHLTGAGRATVTLRPGKGITADPAEFEVNLPAGGSATQWVDFTLAENARLGTLKIPWSSTSEDARLVTDDVLLLTVADPVPTAGIKRTPAPPKIDGELDDTVWRSEPVVANMNLLRGGKPATQQTTVWMSYDDTGVYIAFRCAEAMMNKIKARYTERGDPLYQDDDVEIFILPPGARQPAVLPKLSLMVPNGLIANWKA
ncbi:MAG: carbohydrate-binding family 9-like protein, partial [Armatimonadetes bacterium]|nr:carbohydrate-binding family 9-like protein [Armatimonadota bacterium]